MNSYLTFSVPHLAFFFLSGLCVLLGAILAVRGLMRFRRLQRDGRQLERIRAEMERQGFDRMLASRTRGVGLR